MKLYSIERHADARSAAHAAGAMIAAALEEAIGARGRASFAGAGGRTPGEAYAWLSTADLAWEKVTVTLTDERWVDPDSPQSNEALLRDTLLREKAATARLLPLWSMAPDPEAAARALGPALEHELPFDAVLLGMGEDGHFASLFPGSPALDAGLDPNGKTLVVAAPAGEPMPPQPRISLTLAALLQSRLTVLMITGEAKLKVLQHSTGLPISALLSASDARLHILWAP